MKPCSDLECTWCRRHRAFRLVPEPVKVDSVLASVIFREEESSVGIEGKRRKIQGYSNFYAKQVGLTFCSLRDLLWFPHGQCYHDFDVLKKSNLATGISS